MKIGIFIFIISFFTFAQPSHAQHIRGVVKDKNGSYLSNISIGIVGTSMGTLTNDEGYFELKNVTKGTKLKFTSIGYESKVIINEKNFYEIELTESDVKLGSLIVMPDSSLKNILKVAFLSIDANYPNSPEKIEGYFTESEQTADGKQLYLGESILNLYHIGYHKPSSIGQVEMIKSRVFVNEKKDSLDNTQWAGGIFLPLENDPVRNRFSYLDYKNFNKKYRYSLTSETTFDSDSVYVIDFTSLEKGSDYKGRLYIDKKCKAYIKITRESYSKGKSSFLDSKPLSSNYIFTYKKNNGKWHLETSQFEAEYRNRRKDLNVRLKASFFVLKQIIPAIPIALEKRENSFYIYAKPTNNIDPDFFTDYNRVLPNQKENEFLNSLISSNVKKEDIKLKGRNVLVNNLMKFSLDYGFSVGNINRNVAPIFYNNVMTFSNSYYNSYLFQPFFNYKLSNRLELTYSNIQDIGVKNFSYKQNELFAKYKFLVKKKGNPAYFVPFFGGGFQKITNEFQNISTSSGITLNNINVGNNIAFNRISRSKTISIGTSVNYISKKWKWTLFAQRTFDFGNKTLVNFKNELIDSYDVNFKNTNQKSLSFIGIAFSTHL